MRVPARLRPGPPPRPGGLTTLAQYRLVRGGSAPRRGRRVGILAIAVNVLNHSFEADRVSQTTMAGWTDTANVSNRSGGHTGRWSTQEYSASAYSSGIYQNIPLPNGTYTLSAWVESSGGQTTANLYAKNFGASEADASINQAIGTWKQVSISGITVTNGSIQVGVSSDAAAGKWLYADDFSLVRTS